MDQMTQFVRIAPGQSRLEYTGPQVFTPTQQAGPWQQLQFHIHTDKIFMHKTDIMVIHTFK